MPAGSVGSSAIRETKSPISLMITGLLQQIELISAAGGSSIDLVEDLLAVVRKHDKDTGPKRGL